MDFNDRLLVELLDAASPRFFRLLRFFFDREIDNCDWDVSSMVLVSTEVIEFCFLCHQEEVDLPSLSLDWSGAVSSSGKGGGASAGGGADGASSGELSSCA